MIKQASVCLATFLTLGVTNFALAGCGAETSEQSDEIDSVMRDPGELPLLDRTDSFRNLEELTAASDAIVVATVGNTPLSLAPRADQMNPMVRVGATVEQVVDGRLRGRSIGLIAEGRLQDDKLETNKFSSGTTYLLYLTASPFATGDYYVTGYLAGLYEETDDGFGKVDPGSPKLPDLLSISVDENASVVVVEP